MKESITAKEAIELAKEIFSKAYDHWSKASDHWSKASDHWSKASDHWSKASDHENKAYDHESKAYDHRSKASDHWSKAYGTFYQVLSKHKIIHSVPDHRAFNVKCADRDGMVYCFVWVREEIWVYDGQDCPSSDTVEKLNWKYDKNDNARP